MSMHASLHEVITTGLDSLVSGLQARMIPADQYTSDRGAVLQQVIARLGVEQGTEAEAYLLAHWALQIHELLQAQVTAMTPEIITPEIALSDLERMQALANLLRLNEEYALLDTLRAQIEQGIYTFAAFRTVSGGFETMEEMTAAMLAALGERIAVLGGADVRSRIGDPVDLLTLLADSEVLSRFLLNASRNRLTQCMILAHMVMIMREFQRLGIRTAPMGDAADALRLTQLGEIVGVQPIVRRTAYRAPASRPEGDEPAPPAAEPEPAATAPPPPAEIAPPASDAGLTIDLGPTPTADNPTPTEMEMEPFRDEDTTPEPTVSPAVPETNPFAPEPDPFEPEAGSSGLGRMLGMLLLAVGAVALLIVFVVRPPWLEVALDNLQTLSGGQPAVPTVVVVAPAATLTSLPTATATPLPPTPTQAPEPTPAPALEDIVTANTDLALYEWPQLLAEVVGMVETKAVVVPLQAVAGADQRWLRLDNGYYVLADGVDNVPAELPVIAVTELEGMPDFSAGVPATPPDSEAETPDPEAAAAPAEDAPPVEEPEPEPATPYILATTRMRAGPGEEFPDKGELAAGTLVTLMGINRDATWFMLDNRYWVPLSAVSQVLDGLSVRVPSYAQVDANLRESPTASSPRVGGVQANDTLVLVGRQEGTNPDGTWYKLDTGGWIFGDLVGDAPEDLPYIE